MDLEHIRRNPDGTIRESFYYRIVRACVRLFFPKAKTVFAEEPQSGPCVFVANHSAVRGPVMMTLDFPRRHETWTISSALDRAKSANYVFHDVFFGESRKWKGFWRLLSRFIGYALPPLLWYSGVIPVYHDRRIMRTFQESAAALRRGEDLVIFAESPKRYSAYVNELQSGFIDLARYYYRKAGERIAFYPVYLEKKHRIISVGRPIVYDPDLPNAEQKAQIAIYLRNEIDALGNALPRHQPVPFLPQRWYDAYGQYEESDADYWKLLNGELSATDNA